MTRDDSSARNVRRYRERMRRSGLRLVQLWLPDTRARGFAAECRRQSRAAAAKRGAERSVHRWLDEVRDVEGWTG
jgi:hypothetical protein